MDVVTSIVKMEDKWKEGVSNCEVNTQFNKIKFVIIII